MRWPREGPTSAENRALPQFPRPVRRRNKCRPGACRTGPLRPASARPARRTAIAERARRPDRRALTPPQGGTRSGGPAPVCRLATPALQCRRGFRPEQEWQTDRCFVSRCAKRPGERMAAFLRTAALSAHRLAVELLQPYHQQSHVDGGEGRNHHHGVDVIGLGQSAAQPFAGIDQRVDEHGVLQHGEAS